MKHIVPSSCCFYDLWVWVSWIVLNKGDLLCWLRLGWLKQVCVYSRNYDARIHRLGFKYTRTCLSQPSLSQHSKSPTSINISFSTRRLSLRRASWGRSTYFGKEMNRTKKHPFPVSLGSTVQQQKPLSTPWLGSLKAHFPTSSSPEELLFCRQRYNTSSCNTPHHLQHRRSRLFVPVLLRLPIAMLHNDNLSRNAVVTSRLAASQKWIEGF